MKRYIILFLIIISVKSEAQLLPFVEDGMVGYVDTSGIVQIPARYDTEHEVINLVVDNAKYRKIEFPRNAYFTEGRATARIGWKVWFLTLFYEYTLIDKTGGFFFQPGFIIYENFSEGLAPIINLEVSTYYSYDYQYGYGDSLGNVIIGSKFKYAGSFSEGLAHVLENNKYGYINNKGRYIIPVQFDNAFSFSDGLAVVKMGDKYGYINKDGNYVIKPEFEMAWEVHDDVAVVMTNGLYRMIKIHRQNRSYEFITPEYRFIGKISSGLAPFEEVGKYGYLNTNGKVEIAPKFDDAMEFSEGLAVVNHNGFFGYIDPTGSFVIDPVYDLADSFHHGAGIVWTQGDVYYINKAGYKFYKLLSADD